MNGDSSYYAFKDSILLSIVVMYICKSEADAKSKFAQLEIIDYLGFKRTIVFDLDNPVEAQKARKILKPKGIRRHKRSTRQKSLNYKQQALTQDFYQKPLIPKISSKETLQKSIIKPKVQKTSDKLLQPRKTSNIPTEIKKSSKMNIAHVESQKPTSYNEATESYSPSPQKISQPSVENKPYPKNLMNLFQSDKKPEFGFGGNVEVVCPYCSEEIYFDYDDLDENRYENTRQCDCNAILRISIRDFHRKIFQDLLPDSLKHFVDFRKIDTRIQDEYGNMIKIYGINLKSP